MHPLRRTLVRLALCAAMHITNHIFAASYSTVQVCDASKASHLYYCQDNSFK
jgi:hypothetical protein